MKDYPPGRLKRFGQGARHLWQRWVDPVFSIQRAVTSLGPYTRYLSSWRRYTNLPGAEPLRFRDSHPCLFDATDVTPYDPHYFYQAVWAMGRIARSGAKKHVDVGSDVIFVGLLATHLSVTFVDFRPLGAKLPQLTSVAGTILALPFADRSIDSISCLHVAEHVGLGRYGDPLDPSGTRRACAELARVLAPRGNLFFSVPVGQPRVCFNAHRIHSPRQILEYFSSLDLVEFSAVDDRGELLIDAKPEQLENVVYGCGLFWLRRNRSSQ
jgi:SAM-dependent methyltransferase